MDTRSTGEVVASLIVNVQAMVAKELELARLELRRMVGRKVAAVGMLLVGALAFLVVLLLGAVTAAVALEEVLDARWMAWGVVTLSAAVLGLVLVGIAGRLLSRGWSLDASRAAATSTADWLRGLGDELTGRPPRSDATGDATEVGR